MTFPARFPAWLSVPALGVMLHAAPALARGPFVAALPNGSVHSCRLCHTQAAGNSPLNAFGALTAMRPATDAGLSDMLDWKTWSRVDSDMDGFTNGQELGDPCGTWVPGNADPVMTTVGNPGEASSVPVGAPGPCTEQPATSTSSSSGGGGGPGCGNATLAAVGPAGWLAVALALVRRRSRGRP